MRRPVRHRRPRRGARARRRTARSPSPATVRGAGGEGALVARFTAAGALDTTFAGSGSRLDRFGAGARAGGAPARRRGRRRARRRHDRRGRRGRARSWSRATCPTARSTASSAPAASCCATCRRAAACRRAPGLAADRAHGRGPDRRRRQRRRRGRRPLRRERARRAGRRRPPQRTWRARPVVRQRRLQRSSSSAPAARAGRRARRSPRSRSAPSGTIVLAGRSSATNGADRALVARLTAAGRLDSGFGPRGRRVVQFGRASSARAGELLAGRARPAPRRPPAGRGPWHRRQGGRRSCWRLHRRRRARPELRPRRQRAHAARRRDRARATRRPRRAGARVDAGRRRFVAGAASLDGAPRCALAAASAGELDCGYGAKGAGAGLRPLRGLRSPRRTAPSACSPTRRQATCGAGRRPGGGLLLGRLFAGPSRARRPRPAPARRCARATLARGRGYAYGVVDGDCATTSVRFVVLGRRGARRHVDGGATRPGRASARRSSARRCAACGGRDLPHPHRPRQARAAARARALRAVRARRTSRRLRLRRRGPSLDARGSADAGVVLAGLPDFFALPLLLARPVVERLLRRIDRDRVRGTVGQLVQADVVDVVNVSQDWW